MPRASPGYCVARALHGGNIGGCNALYKGVARYTPFAVARVKWGVARSCTGVARSMTRGVRKLAADPLAPTLARRFPSLAVPKPGGKPPLLQGGKTQRCTCRNTRALWLFAMARVSCPTGDQ